MTSEGSSLSCTFSFSQAFQLGSGIYKMPLNSVRQEWLLLVIRKDATQKKRQVLEILSGCTPRPTSFKLIAFCLPGQSLSLG